MAFSHHQESVPSRLKAVRFSLKQYVFGLARDVVGDLQQQRMVHPVAAYIGIITEALYIPWLKYSGYKKKRKHYIDTNLLTNSLKTRGSTTDSALP